MIAELVADRVEQCDDGSVDSMHEIIQTSLPEVIHSATRSLVYTVLVERGHCPSGGLSASSVTTRHDGHQATTLVPPAGALASALHSEQVAQQQVQEQRQQHPPCAHHQQHFQDPSVSDLTLERAEQQQEPPASQAQQRPSQHQQLHHHHAQPQQPQLLQHQAQEPTDADQQQQSSPPQEHSSAAPEQAFPWNEETSECLARVRQLHSGGNTKGIRQAAVSALRALQQGDVSDDMVGRELTRLLALERPVARRAAQQAASQAVSQPAHQAGQPTAIGRFIDQRGVGRSPAGQPAPPIALPPIASHLQAYYEEYDEVEAELERSEEALLLLGGGPTAEQRKLLRHDNSKEHKMFYRWKLALFKLFYKFAKRWPASLLYLTIASPHGDRRQLWSDARGGGYNLQSMLDDINADMQVHHKEALAVVQFQGESFCDVERSINTDGKYVKGETTCKDSSGQLLLHAS